VAALVVLICLGFVTQEVVNERWGDPYPDLGLPAFVVPPAVVVNRVASLEVRFEDGSVSKVTSARFAGLSVPHPSSLMNSLFWADTVAAGGGAPKGDFVLRDPSAEEFVRARVAELFPGLEASRLTVTWIGEATPLVGSASPTSRVLRTVHVEL
jgi:hypothetical protein